MIKRSFDLIASSCGLLVFSPLLALIAVWIKHDSPGPVFYRAERAGRGGKTFKIFKFRSMVTNADQIGGPTTSGNDPRVTRSGEFIRKCKLDELSQLINVVRGEMSLVGPRPEIVSKVENFTEEERKTLELRPGITDWASIWNSDEGGVLQDAPDPDAVYEQIIRPRKMELQLYYYKNRSMVADVKIIFCTLIRIIDKNWIPREIQGYPTFAELREEALKVIEQQRSEQHQSETSPSEATTQ